MLEQSDFPQRRGIVFWMIAMTSFSQNLAFASIFVPDTLQVKQTHSCYMQMWCKVSAILLAMFTVPEVLENGCIQRSARWCQNVLIYCKMRRVYKQHVLNLLFRMRVPVLWFFCNSVTPLGCQSSRKSVIREHYHPKSRNLKENNDWGTMVSLKWAPNGHCPCAQPGCR